MKNLILTILTFISLQSLAGISSVGNGGGLGELQLIYYFNNTDQIIAICEQSRTCQQTVEQRSSWQKLKTQLKEIKTKTQISFVPVQALLWTWTNANLLISQQWLYQNKLELLRTDAEIMIFALAVQLSHTQHLDFEKTYKQTAASLNGLSFYNQTSASTSSELKFHWITLSDSANGKEHLKLFVLEDGSNSHALNKLIQKKQSSINMNSLEIYNVMVVNNGSELSVYGSVSGYSNSVYFNQRPFKFTASLTNQKIIIEESIQFYLFLE